METTQLAPQRIAQFRRSIYKHYHEHKRDFPWRQTTNPYHILVSEIMLQQTQTSRVMTKYLGFIEEFPDFVTLAQAPLRKVLHAWQGLGYNRRALALHQIAKTVTSKFGGKLPSSSDILVTLPGIGSYTASAIAALAFNQPTAFIETNIRTVFLHFFFPNHEKVTDRDILPLIAHTLDNKNLSEWYYALFDYGVMLKQKQNLAPRSAHYHKQSPFPGSNRQLRGRIISLLLAHRSLTEKEMNRQLNQSPPRIRAMLEQLQKEGFLNITGGAIAIT